jgi:hypothetical protein
MFSELSGNRLYSPKLWKGFAPPYTGLFETESGNPAIGLFDDFLNFAVVRVVTSNAGTYLSNGIAYESFEDDAGIAQETPGATTAPGAITLQSGTHDNDAAALQAKGLPFNAIAASAKELVFETRFKVSAITTACTDLFIGLAGTGAAANSGIQTDDSTTLASNNFLGFVRKAAATSGLTFTVQRGAGTEQAHADVGTLVADTYIKAGFRFNAERKNCSIWINGEQVHEVTKAQVAAAPWPTLFMNFAAEMKYQATAAHILTIDWWACAQYV